MSALSDTISKHHSDQSSQSSLRPFYLNIILLNKEEIVASKVTSKAGNGFFGKAAAYAANKIVTDEKITTNIAESLIDGVTKATSEMGITAEMEVKFHQGAFVVIRVQVTEVEKLQLILSAKGPEFASNFANLLATLHALGMGDMVDAKIDGKINEKINSGMMEKFRELIPQKMSEKGVLVDCQVSSAEDEAELFFELLGSIKEVLGK